MNDIHALSGAYALDALDDAERTAFEAHLSDCTSCMVEVAELIETASRLGSLTETEPPAGQRAAVLAGIATVRPLPPLVPLPVNEPEQEPTDEPAAAKHRASVEPVATDGPSSIALAAAQRRAANRVVTPTQRRAATSGPFWANSRQRVVSLVAAAAAVAAIGTGLAITTPWHDETGTPSASTQVLTADDAERVTLSFPDGARATVVRSVEAGRAVLITQDMPAPPDGKVYQVWLEDEAGSMVPAAVMPIKPDQTVVLDGDAAAASAAGITVEPAGGSPAPTSEPIALFAFEGGA